MVPALPAVLLERPVATRMGCCSASSSVGMLTPPSRALAAPTVSKAKDRSDVLPTMTGEPIEIIVGVAGQNAAGLACAAALSAALLPSDFVPLEYKGFCAACRVCGCAVAVLRRFSAARLRPHCESGRQA